MLKKLNLKAIGLTVAGSTIGIVGSAKVDSIPFVAKQNPLVKGLGKVVIGALLPNLMKSKPGDLVSNACVAMAGYGGAQIINNFMPGMGISGIPTIAGMPSLGEVKFDEEYNGLSESEAAALL